MWFKLDFRSLNPDVIGDWLVLQPLKSGIAGENSTHRRLCEKLHRVRGHHGVRGCGDDHRTNSAVLGDFEMHTKFEAKQPYYRYILVKRNIEIEI